MDVSRGCVITDNDKLPLSNKIKATLLWMDDNELTIGQNYMVKLGTKTISGIINSIEYTVDVNTGEHLTADTITKNGIALCEIELAEKIVVDRFKSNKTLGELILIDRVTNMTSACGVVEDVDTEGEKPYFEKDDIQVGGYTFEEFYFNLENAFLSKQKTTDKTWHVGDEVPVEGDSFKYPDYFDILSVESQAVVRIRGRKIEDIISLKEYQYSGLPVVDERGFAIRAKSEADVDNYVYEFSKISDEGKVDFYNKWTKFETYRKVVCNDNFWII